LDLVLLFVCEGNLCRSPMAEYLARRTVGTVTSAGTHAIDGREIHPKALAALAELGIDASDFRSRKLTPELVALGALTLTPSRAQRAACVSLAPPQRGKVFTLRQFSRLVDAAGLHRPTNVDGVLEAVTVVRERIQPVPPAHDEVADPVEGTLDDMRACMCLIQRDLERVLTVIDLP
jgi:protein-tyrosine phosphatase